MKELFIIRPIHRSSKIRLGIFTIVALGVIGSVSLSVQAASHANQERPQQTKRIRTKKHHGKKNPHKKTRQVASATTTSPTEAATSEQEPAPTTTDNSQNNSDSAGVIIGNSRTMVYHTPDQSNYHINSGNIVSFHSEAEAQAAGYHKAAR